MQSMESALHILLAVAHYQEPSAEDAEQLGRIAAELGVADLGIMPLDELACEVIMTIIKRSREEAKARGV
jgi:hypothetical protein